MVVIEPPVLDKEKQAGLMKRAHWNVRLIPVALAALAAIFLYFDFAPHPPLTLPNAICLNVMVFGAFVWLECFYKDEKYLLETGRQRTSVGYTVGLFFALVGLAGSHYFDKKPSSFPWYSFFLFFLFGINVITDATKHIAAYKKRKRGLKL